MAPLAIVLLGTFCGASESTVSSGFAPWGFLLWSEAQAALYFGPRVLQVILSNLSSHNHTSTTQAVSSGGLSLICTPLQLTAHKLAARITVKSA